jgi:hypothetical protein
MLRACVVAITITLVAGLTPASAQGGGGCEQYCRGGPCSGGGVGYAPGAPKCMQACIARCQQKKGKFK